MTREKKAEVIKDLTEKFASNSVFYITDAGGLTVAKTNFLRRLCFNSGIEYVVVKNTLIKKALETLDTDYSSFDESVLKGFSGVMFHPETGKAPAVVLQDFLKKHKDGVTLKGASIDGGLYVGHEHLESLAKLKSRDEMIGEVIGLLQSPAKNVLGALQSGGHNLAGILKTLSEKEAA